MARKVVEQAKTKKLKEKNKVYELYAPCLLKRHHIRAYTLYYKKLR